MLSAYCNDDSWTIKYIHCKPTAKIFMSFKPAEITENTIASFEKAIDQVSVLHVLYIVTSCVHDGW